jgi:hypothetical protein
VSDSPVTGRGLAVPDEYLREIGRITVGFNRIEGLVRFAVWDFSGVADDKFTIMTMGDRFRQLTDKMKALLPLAVDDEQLREAFTAWLADADLANQLRVHAVHSSWLKSSSDETKVLTVMVKRSGWGMASLSLEEVAGHARYIELVAAKGLELFERFRPDVFSADEESPPTEEPGRAADVPHED